MHPTTSTTPSTIVLCDALASFIRTSRFWGTDPDHILDVCLDVLEKWPPRAAHPDPEPEPSTQLCLFKVGGEAHP